MSVFIFFLNSKYDYNFVQNILKSINKCWIFISIWKCLSLHLSYLVLIAKLAKSGELSIVILFVMVSFGELTVAKRMTHFSPSSPIVSLAKQIEYCQYSFSSSFGSNNCRQKLTVRGRVNFKAVCWCLFSISFQLNSQSKRCVILPKRLLFIDCGNIHWIQTKW